MFEEQKYIVNKTGCLIPCKYREYEIMGESKEGPEYVFHTKLMDGYFIINTS